MFAGRLVDDVVEQVAQDVAERRPRLEADRDEVVAVDGLICEPVRAALRSRFSVRLKRSSFSISSSGGSPSSPGLPQ